MTKLKYIEEILPLIGLKLLSYFFKIIFFSFLHFAKTFIRSINFLHVEKILILIQKGLSLILRDAVLFESVPSDSAVFNNHKFHNKSYRSFTFISEGVFSIAMIYFNIFIIYMISMFMKFFHANCRYIFIYLRLALYICMIILYIRYIWFSSITVKLSADVEENPVPKPKSCQCFSICHWNVNSVSDHKFSKVCLYMYS